jgi:hypothetical protein
MMIWIVIGLRKKREMLLQREMRNLPQRKQLRLGKWTLRETFSKELLNFV